MDDVDRVRTGDLTAALDQAAATLGDIAALLGAYRVRLMAAGFDNLDALELCRDLQDFILSGER